MRWSAAWQAFLAAYLVFVGGAALSDLVGKHAAGIMALGGAALQAGTAAYYAAVSKSADAPLRVP